MSGQRASAAVGDECGLGEIRTSAFVAAKARFCGGNGKQARGVRCLGLYRGRGKQILPKSGLGWLGEKSFSDTREEGERRGGSVADVRGPLDSDY